MRRLIILFVVIVINGCSSSETVVKEYELPVVPPVIQETLPGIPGLTGENVLTLPDTLYFFQIDTVKANPDTVIDARYIVKRNELDVKVKPDTLLVTVNDTVKITKTILNETSWLEKLGFMFLGFVVIAGAWFVIKKFI
jgi:hypothetical protein